MLNGLVLLALTTALFYVIQASGLYYLLHKNVRFSHALTLLALLPAVMQAVLLRQLIDTSVGQNLNLINVACMVSWLIVLLLMIPGRHLSAPLLIIVMPIAGVLSALAPWFPASPIRVLSGEWASLAHIFTALLAYSLMMVAALQAIILWWLEHQLRAAPLASAPWLPPLQLQDAFLFRLIGAGFFLLSATIVIAALGVPEAFSHTALHKTILSIISWGIFGVLLIGRYRKGWRGRTAARWTLAGFGFLALAYIGTRVVIEFVLSPS